MAIASQKDFYSGLMFIAAGGGFALGAREYEIGDAARMGPGYFPFMLGTLLAILGVIIAFNSLRKGMPGGDPVGKFAWRPLIFILGANLAFGALMVGVPALGFPQFGLVIAIYGLVFISSMARKEFSWKTNFKEVLILATVLAVGSYVAFVYLLNLQFPVWPAFMNN